MKALIRIVDDDEELARSYALLLETAGWECRVWTDGTRFLEEERFERPGCVILDMRMPGMNGLEVQKALAELDERSRRVIEARYLHQDADGKAKPVTLQALAKEFGVSAERIRQIEKQAIEKLRRLLSEASPL